MKNTLFGFLLIAYIIGTVATASAKIIFVKATATGTNAGTSWKNAYRNLQLALTEAVSGDEIWVAAGTYKPSATSDASASFVMVPSTGLYGGFAGTETARSQRNWRLNETILSGDIGVQGDPSDNSSNIVIGASYSTLDGFTVTGARGNIYDGGGMRNWYKKSVVVTNCKFTANSSQRGAGIYNEVSSLTITSCTLSGNISSGWGGGIHNWSSSMTMTSCTLASNVSNDGGGIYNDNSLTYVTNCTFIGNLGNLYGGAIFTNGSGDSGDSVNACTFRDNIGVYSGGGMYNGYCAKYNQVINKCVFTGNTAGQGGGVFNQDRRQSMSNCIFIGNSGGEGGAIYNASFGGLPVKINNSCFFGNSAASGGVLYNYGPLQMTNCTSTSNSATLTGGALYNFGGSPVMTNSILWGNTAPTGPEIFIKLGAPFFDHCDIQGSGASGTAWNTAIGADIGGNIDKDPKFVSTTNPAGADKKWLTADDGLRLKVGSPCINSAITTNDVPEYDILGKNRSTPPDIGAYEYPTAGVAGWMVYQ